MQCPSSALVVTTFMPAGSRLALIWAVEKYTSVPPSQQWKERSGISGFVPAAAGREGRAGVGMGEGNGAQPSHLWAAGQAEEDAVNSAGGGCSSQARAILPLLTGRGPHGDGEGEFMERAG